MFYNRENLLGIESGTYEFVCNPTPIASSLFLYIEYIGHAVCNKQYALVRTSYSHYLLMYLLRGKAVLQTEEKKYVVEPNQAFLIDTSRPHVYGCVEDMECLWVHFNGADFSPFFAHLIQCNRGNHVFSLQNTPDFLLHFQTLVDNFKRDFVMPEILISARLHELLALLCLSCQPAKHSPIDEILYYINQHYADTLTLQFLANRSCLSSSRFSTIFKQITHISPYQYILQTRLHAACQYLSNSCLSVDAISAQVGFQNCSTFIRAFQQRYHTTPHQFRKQIENHAYEYKESRHSDMLPL